MVVSVQRLMPLLVLATVVAGCGGGGGGGGPSPQPTATATASPGATAVPTSIPGATPTAAPLPGVPFDLRGRVFVDGVPTAGVLVTVTGAPGSVAASDQTSTDAAGQYSFFLVAGTYVVKAGAASRMVTIPPGGQTVDNLDLAT